MQQQPSSQNPPQAKIGFADQLLTGLVGLQSNTLADMRCFVHSVNHQARQLSPTFEDQSDKNPEKQGMLSQIRSQLNRVTRWRNEIQQTQQQGRDITTAAYMLRVMRLTGDDRYHMLPEATRLLASLGFDEVAQVAGLLYGSQTPQEKFQLQRDWLDSRRRLLADNPQPDCEIQIDRRTLDQPRVSMIVSMYNAADKLAAFLKHVSEQSLAHKGQLEVILIDSQSPTDELGLFEQMADQLNFSALYFRTPKRETIQQAWNRGIALSRSPYLVFWGVDEGGDPPILEKLADTLDADDQLDWAQTGSRTLELDKQGKVIMQTYAYDCSEYQHGDMYLDHMLLTYVGAMYRKRIHDRVGYYDASFRASGDTEFKMRMLPAIKAKTLPTNDGIYFNYPDERMTNHPRAEIEDCRSFDIFRTAAGVAYSFGDRAPRQLDEQVLRALRYHNACYPHWWSDLQSAELLAQLRDSKASPTDMFAVKTDELSRLHARYRHLDCCQSLASLARTGLAATSFMRKVRRRMSDVYQPACWIFNDMRYARYARVWPV